MPRIEHYPRDYAGSRRAFRSAAEAGFALSEIRYRATDLNGEALFCDIGWRDAQSECTLCVISGMHGVELFAGSACQCLLAEGIADIPPDINVLLVHAVNPWGSAHLRRQNELNVDPCRNFVDFDEPIPQNVVYEQLHYPALRAGGAGEAAFQARDVLEQLRAEMGEGAYTSALMAGQYRHRDGFAFGGYAPSETRTTLQTLLKRYATKQTVIVELHTGLGPRGEATFVSMQAGQTVERVRAAFSAADLGGKVHAPAADAATGEALAQFPVVYGHSTEGYARLLEDHDLISLVLEFGTADYAEVIGALLADHWQYHAGVHPAEEALIKDRLLETFSPDGAEWIEAVRTAFERALPALCELVA